MTNEEPLRIKYTKSFKKDLKNASIKIQIAFREARDLFYTDSYHPALRNHPLTGKFAGFRSVDVTDDYRAIFKIRKGQKEIIITFHLLGTHNQLYV